MQTSLTVQLQTICKAHSLQYIKICSNQHCLCSIKLCSKCCSQHERQNPNSQLLTIQQYQRGVILDNKLFISGNNNSKNFKKGYLQNGWADQQYKEQTIKFNKFVDFMPNVLQCSLDLLNQERMNVKQQVQASVNKINTQIQKIQNNSAQYIKHKHFLKLIFDKDLIKTAIDLQQNQGMSRLILKLDQIKNLNVEYQNFLLQSHKFGQDKQKFVMSSSITSQSTSIKQLIKNIIQGKSLPEPKKLIQPQRKRSSSNAIRFNQW